MTLKIFKAHEDKVETINRVTKVLNHSAATAYNGLDIEIYYINACNQIMTRRKHIDKWDFYSVEV